MAHVSWVHFPLSHPPMLTRGLHPCREAWIFRANLSLSLVVRGCSAGCVQLSALDISLHQCADGFPCPHTVSRHCQRTQQQVLNRHKQVLKPIPLPTHCPWSVHPSAPPPPHPSQGFPGLRNEGMGLQGPLHSCQCTQPTGIWSRGLGCVQTPEPQNKVTQRSRALAEE